MYGSGQSEEWIGEWMAARKVRNQMVLATKFTEAVNAFDRQDVSVINLNYAGNSKKSLRVSLEESLERLKTNYVDIYYVHAWDGLTSIPELMRALDDVVRSGKVLYLGASNFPAWVVVKANEYARQHGLSQFVVFEGRWNAAERDIERDILPMCKAEGMAIAAWSSLGAGKFKSTIQAKDPNGRKMPVELFGPSEEEFRKVALVMEEIGNRKGTDATAIALRYVMLKSPYVYPIVGCRTLDQLKRNIEALKINITEEEIEQIEAAAPFEYGYPYCMLAWHRHKTISITNPTCVIRKAGLFDGIEEVKPIRTIH